jgi:hypothetical protein
MSSWPSSLAAERPATAHWRRDSTIDRSALWDAASLVDTRPEPSICRGRRRSLTRLRLARPRANLPRTDVRSVDIGGFAEATTCTGSANIGRRARGLPASLCREEPGNVLIREKGPAVCRLGK